MNTRNTKRTPESKEVEMTDQEVEKYLAKQRKIKVKGGTCKLCKLTYKCYFKAHLKGLVHQNWIDERENKKINNDKEDIKKKSAKPNKKRSSDESSNKKRSSDESSSSHNDSDDSDDPDYEPKPTKKPTNKKGKRFN